MLREDAIPAQGEVVEVLEPSLCRVRLLNGHVLYVRAQRKLVAAGWKPVVGQQISFEVSPFDLGRGMAV